MVFVVLALYDLLFCKQLWKPARHGKRLHSSRRRNVSWHVLDSVLLAPSHKLVFHPKGLRMAGIQSVQATIIAFIKDISRKISLAGWLWSVKLGTMPMWSSLVSKGSTLDSLKLWFLQFLLGFGFTIIDIPWVMKIPKIDPAVSLMPGLISLTGKRATMSWTSGKPSALMMRWMPWTTCD